MCSLLTFLLPFAGILTATTTDEGCDSSKYHLLILAIADESFDSTNRLKQSAEQYDVTVRIISEARKTGNEVRVSFLILPFSKCFLIQQNFGKLLVNFVCCDRFFFRKGYQIDY